MSKVLLEVKNLKKYFQTPKGQLHAVDNVNFAIEEGKTLGVVGESGCGKSTTGRTILRLLEATDGEIIFEGKNIRDYSKAEMKKLREEMQIIFQDPFASLNPRMTVSEIIAEPLIIHNKCKTKEELNNRVKELMDTVGLSERLVNTYPHELDGGRRQRIGIARALALNPKFIVCDEPVSALDVSIQAQVLNLMKDLQEKLGLTYMFITHDLSVVKYFSNDIAVMYLGELVEKAPSKDLFKILFTLILRLYYQQYLQLISERKWKELNLKEKSLHLSIQELVVDLQKDVFMLQKSVQKSLQN